MEAGSAAAAALEQARDAPSGELRIAAPLGFASHLASALAPVLADWPNLRLRLLVDDRLIDLIDARVDLALRVGSLPDTSWIGRKLCDLEGILCASPAYLDRRGVPAAPGDLPHHSWLAMIGAAADPAGHGGSEAHDQPLALDLVDVGGARQCVRAPVRISTTSQVAVQQLCEEGMGVASLFYPDVRPALERGLLVRLLPAWRLPSSPVTMVTQRNEGEAAKVRFAVDALKRYFASLPRLG